MPIPTITLVHAPGCHFCADAQDALAEPEREFTLRVDLVEAGSGAGCSTRSAGTCPAEPMKVHRHDDHDGARDLTAS